MVAKKKVVEEKILSKGTVTKKVKALAQVKWEIKQLEITAKLLGKEILGSKHAPLEYDMGEQGLLKKIKRDNFSMADSYDIQDTVGEKFFMENCSLAAGKIKSEIGESGFNQLIKDGSIMKNDPIIYYQLYAAKKKKIKK